MASESSHSPWTNLWDCWTFQDLDSVGSPDLEATSTTTSNISLRSVQKPSGLFDNEYAGIGHDLDAGNDHMDFDIEEWICKDRGDNSVIQLDSVQEAQVEDLLDSMASVLHEDDFLNSFMDLSNFSAEDEDITQTSQAVSDESSTVAPVIHITETEAGINIETGGQKRKLDDVDFMVVDPAAAGLDHAYTSKKPRPEYEQVVVDPFSEESHAPWSHRTKAEKYRDRRVKNNIASKRSRETRKMKFSAMETEADRLIGENARLREKIEVLENLAKEMKASLISKIAGKE